MFETSKDVLYLVLSVSIGLLTAFLVWGLYYIVMLLRRGYAIVREISDLIIHIKNKLDRLEHLFDTIEEKLKNSASYLPLVMKGVTEIIEFIKNKRAARSTRKTNKSSNSNRS